MRFAVGLLLALSLFAQPPIGYRRQPPNRKQVLIWCDMQGGGAYHDSVSHAMAVIEHMGRETGLYDAYIRTDSQFITKQNLTVKADGRDWRVGKNLNSFDAIFFYGMREIPLTDQQKADLLSFVKNDGKGFVAAHTADTAFMEWPEFGEMLGARFDGHPWGIIEAPIIVEDPSFPAVKQFPPVFPIRDEIYQAKDFSRDAIRILLRLDSSGVDLKHSGVHRTDGDFPQAWAKTYGKGRVFFCAFGHETELWDEPAIRTMWLEAIKWALGMTNADITPRRLVLSAK
ncbi:MAG TPA: ThuA domain-containing protein [Bryobacteraceae bacterium]|nr:ThuA domain-containing protein [Bryobacteraceae bacterium]